MTSPVPPDVTVARMTERHVQLLTERRLIAEHRVLNHQSGTNEVQARLTREIEARVRSEVSGEVVPVAREELWRVGVALSTHRYDDAEFQIALQTINRWLSSPPVQQEADE